MPLRSPVLAGNARLENAASGGPSVKKAPPPDDVDAVRRIQKALVALGLPLPLSFPRGPSSEPDGKFGLETYNAVIAFQKKVFPNDPGQWDGRVGKNTLNQMEQMLSNDQSVEIGPVVVRTTTRCTTIPVSEV
jgi:peptidoglycan hydrolase-like protein with peptidoglycan-binding domain